MQQTMPYLATDGALPGNRRGPILQQTVAGMQANFEQALINKCMMQEAWVVSGLGGRYHP